MDIEGILLQIDAELEKLKQVRKIVQSLTTLDHPIKSERKRRVAKTSTPKIEESQPVVVMLPPKQTRHYSPRVKPAIQEPKALNASIPDRPVFVPKAPLQPKSLIMPESVHMNPELFEAALRQSFLGARA